MARPREFDPYKALSDAMHLFWAHGYDGTSISTLLSGMGLTKGSLYKAFTDKRSLFVKAMTLYEQEQVLPAVALLNDASIPDGRERIKQLFLSIPQAVRQGDVRGCLLCSTAAGPAFYDPDIAQLVEELMGQMKAGFETALKASPAANQTEHLAQLLVTQYVGLRILARAHTPARDLDRGVHSIVDMLAG